MVDSTSPERAADVQRQQAPDRPVRAELLVRPRRHHGAGALVGKLAGQSQARAHGGRGRHRFPAADRALEGLWRRHRLPGRDARDADLGVGPARLDQPHHRVRHRACAAVQSGDRRQGMRDRRPHRQRPLRAQSRGRLERRRVRDVRRRAARAREALRIRAGMARRGQADLVAESGFRLRGPLSQAQGHPRQAEAGRRRAAADHERRRLGDRPRLRGAELRRLLPAGVAHLDARRPPPASRRRRTSRASTAARSAAIRSASSPAGATRRRRRTITATPSSRTPTSRRSTASWR